MSPAARAWLGLAATAAILATAPLWLGRSDLRLMGEVFSYLALAVLWNLLAGYAGLISIGQQAFVGIGGYVLFVLAATYGLSPYLSIPLAMLASGAVAAVLAPLLFRLEGAYFAIGTWVAAETVSLSIGAVPTLGGGAGLSLPTQVVRDMADGREAREWAIYWLLLGAGMGTLAATYALLRSRAGLALMAMRDNGTAAASLGVDIAHTRLLTYVAVAAATGAIGAVIFLQKLRLSPEAAFSLTDWTVVVIFIVVIGGIGRLEGAILGTIFYIVLREVLADQGVLYLIVLGIAAIVVMNLSRAGLWGLIEARTGWALLPVRRHRD